MGVLLIYAGVVRLGRELCLLMSCRHLDALAVASAPLLLGESLGTLTLGGAALILAALAVGGQEDGPVHASDFVHERVRRRSRLSGRN